MPHWRFNLMLMMLIVVTGCLRKPPDIYYNHQKIAVIRFEKSMTSLFDSSYSPATLVQSDINEIDSLYNEGVVDYNACHDVSKKMHETWNYRRQYVCVINNKGQKEVYVNCLCDSMNSWKTELVEIQDGGNCFFNFKINLSTKRYYDFNVNGSG
jgi:hypothetical protein